MLENDVPGIHNASNGRLGVLGLTDVRPLAGQPQDVVLAAGLACDIDAPPSPIEGILPVGGAIRREGPVDRPRIFPEPGSDDLDEEALAVEDLLDVGHASLGTWPIEVRRHDVIVVELHGVETQFLVSSEFAGVNHLLADGWPERVGARADVPRAEGETVSGLAGRSHGRSTSLERAGWTSRSPFRRPPSGLADLRVGCECERVRCGGVARSSLLLVTDQSRRLNDPAGPRPINRLSSSHKRSSWVDLLEQPATATESTAPGQVGIACPVFLSSSHEQLRRRVREGRARGSEGRTRRAFLCTVRA